MLFDSQLSASLTLIFYSADHAISSGVDWRRIFMLSCQKLQESIELKKNIKNVYDIMWFCSIYASVSITLLE